MARINLTCVELAESLPSFEPMLKMAQVNNWGGDFTKLRNQALAERNFQHKCAAKRRAERRDFRNQQWDNAINDGAEEIESVENN